MIVVERIEKDEWQHMAENAHRAVFGEARPAEWDRISYALIATEKGVLYGYCTVKEHDAETAYWQYGGAFPSSEHTVKVYRGTEALLNYFKDKYKRLTALITNENVKAIKLAMAFGFRIIGTRYFGGEIFVELMLDFTKGEIKQCGLS